MRSGRHALHRTGPGPGRLRWPVAVAGLAVAVAAVLAMSPAHADTAHTDTAHTDTAHTGTTTVDAQLSLSGVATRDNVLGGTTVGIHPGDTVDFQASALPTAGLANVPSLGSVLSGALGSLGASQFQVVVSFGASVPGVGGQSVTLGGPSTGSCKGAADQRVSFPKAGTYSFTWTVRTIATSLFGCTANGLNSTTLNQLQQAGVAMNASNEWVGKVVAAADPPKGGISIQLPGVGASPSLPVVGKVPGVTLAPIAPPTLPVGGASLPGLGTGKASSSGSHSAAARSGALSGYTPPALTVPEQVVPTGYGPGGGAASSYQGDGTYQAGGAGGLGLLGASSASSSSAHSGAVPGSRTSASPAPSATIAADIADSSSPLSLGRGLQMPVLLAIVSVIALSLVTALYAHRYLLQKK
jgi:hypothetical protein